MRSVSAKMTPQQARQRPSSQAAAAAVTADAPAATATPSTGGSNLMTNLMITTMLFVASGLNPTTKTMTHQYESMGMGSNPYNFVTANSGLERLALLQDLAAARVQGDDDEEQDPAFISGLHCTDVEKQDSDVMEIEEASSGASFSERPPSAVELQAPVSQLTSSVTLDNVHLLDANEEVLASILSYLPVDSLERMRVLSPALHKAANWVAVSPDFAQGRMMFVYWLEKPTPKPIIPNALPTPFTWRCTNCSNYSDNHKQCVYCGTDINKSACRVFLGQLVKSCAAESVSHMIRSLLPGVTPLHIESHSNRSGHEKGAAWVYMNDPAECELLIGLHKRVYFDEDVSGTLGFWLTGAEDRFPLSRFAEERNVQASRNSVLPRQPLVAEYPMGSLLRTSLEARISAYNDANAGQWERGWYLPRAQQ